MLHVRFAFDPVLPADVDFAMLNKIYGASPESAKGRYSPGMHWLQRQMRPQRLPNRLCGRPKSVEYGSRSVTPYLDKPFDAFAIATADEMRNQQFRVGFDGGPCPSVSSAIDRIFHRGDILLLGGSERPDFIDLNALGFHAANLCVMEASTEAPSVFQEL